MKIPPIAILLSNKKSWNTNYVKIQTRLVGKELNASKLSQMFN